MSISVPWRERMIGGLRRIGLAQPAPPPAPAPGLPGAGQALDRSGVAARRAELADRFAQLQWDLGGLAYEMAIRDHFRMDVLVARAAELQEVEGELAEAERLLRLETGGSAGACPSCGSMYARGAVFCWHCGHRLLEPATPAAQVAPPAPAAPVDPETPTVVAPPAPAPFAGPPPPRR